MHNNDLLILNGQEIDTLLAGQERALIDTVRMAYEAHGNGDTSLPHSTFLRFPHDEKSRIIALPAYLGDRCQMAGIKWVSSFPANLNKGLDRASAVVILSSPETGRPEAILEGSLISAKRTAASAALAAQNLHRADPLHRLSLIGCGVINFEILRFLLAIFPDVKALTVFDLDEARSRQFRDKCQQAHPAIDVDVETDIDAALGSAPLISIATTAIQPHIADLSACAPGSTILHISLRDLLPEVILSCDNVVDDVDHVCRAETSVHLAEQHVGNRDFIRCSLSDILRHTAEAKTDEQRITVFSPFGLGVLDIAVATWARDLGREQGQGTVINSFLPESWVEK